MSAESVPSRLPEDLEGRIYELCLALPRRDAELAALRSEHPLHAGAIEKLVRTLRRAETAVSGVRAIVAGVVDEAVAPGSEVGAFTVVREIGRGAFGRVYEAEQREPVRRTVALKVLAAHGKAPDVMERFQAERQVLAQLEHPGIARILDAGTTATGQPFFAMEYLPGEPLAAYADRRALGIEARLHLFLQVCAAVRHAHQRGVIHRDLKPGNVLVLERDGRPLVKVIDFGLAKVLAADALSGQPLATESGRLLGTPEYMSPEQASGAPVDTRTDVWSLGVMLHELLCGRLPFDSARLRRDGLRSVLEVLGRETPRLPSVVCRADPELSAVAHRRGTTASVLPRRLRGDLDQIVRCCLEQDREQRYSGVAELAADVVRHLQSLPIAARRAGVGYVLTRLARRHRFAFAAAALAAVGLIAGGIATAWSLSRVTQARDEALAANDVAGRRAYAMTMASALAAADGCRTGELRELLAAADPARRGLEWNFLASRIDDSLRALRLGGAQPTTICSLGGRLGWYDRNSQLWTVTDAATGAELHAVLWPWYVGSSVAGDGWCAIAGADGRLAILDASMTEVQREVVIEADEIRSMAVVPGGRLVAAAGRRTVLVEVATGRVLAEQPAQRDVVEAVGVSADGAIVAWGESAGATCVWRLGDNPAVAVVSQGAPVRTLAVHPGGEFVATACRDRVLRVFRVADGEVLAEQMLRNELPQALIYSHDGQVLVSAQSTGSMRWWNGRTLRELGFGLGHDRFVMELARDPGGGIWSISVDGSARLWPVEPPRDRVRVEGMFGTLRGLCADAPRDRLFASSLAGEVASWQIGSWRPLWRRRLPTGMCECVVTTPDGSRVLVTEDSGHVAVLDAASGEVVQRVLPIQGSAPRQLAWLGDGRLLASFTGSELAILEPERLQVQRRIRPPRGPVGMTLALILHPGERLATICMPDCGVRTFDLATGALAWENLDLWPCSGAICPRRGVLCIGRQDGAIVELDPMDGRLLRVVQGPGLDRVAEAIRFTGDGSRLLVANRRNVVLDPDDGTVLLVFDNDWYPPGSIFLLEQHQLLLTGGGYFRDDAELIAWSLAPRLAR